MNARERIVEQFEMSQMAKNGVRSYGKIELPKEVIIRTENVKGEVETTKQSKTIGVVIVPPEPVEDIRNNGREIAKMPKKVAIDKMKTSNRIMKKSNRILTGLHTRVPIIYYVMMVFGLTSVIFGTVTVTSYPFLYSVMIGGIGVFLVALIGFLEIKYTKRILKKSG